MKFAISNCDDYNTYKSYKPILEKYNLEIEIVHELCYYDDDDLDKYEFYHININSLEELIQLQKELSQELIIRNYYQDHGGNEYNELTIKIYDSYNE